jgi:hypothetical protein
MALRSAEYVNNTTEAHVKGPDREHDRNHGNQPTGRLRTSPARPPGDEAAHAGAADVGGVIRSKDQRHRLHQIHRRLNQRGTAQDSRNRRSNERKHQTLLHNRQRGRHLHRTSAAHKEWVWRPAAIEYCTDVVWLAPRHRSGSQQRGRGTALAPECPPASPRFYSGVPAQRRRR